MWKVMVKARQYRGNGECQQHFLPVSNILQNEQDESVL